MLKIGIIGFGFMGRMHYRCWTGRDDCEVTAVCDANKNVIESTKKAIGNLEGAEAPIDFTGIEIFHDLSEMLKKTDLDAVSLTLPTFLHGDGAIQALNAGVHVLCEKPMALTLRDCDRMMEAADKSGKTLQIGHCLRFWPEYVKAKQIVASSQYGAPLSASFRRLSPSPDWSQDDWLKNEEHSGGMALDLHIHDTDIVQFLFGPPKGVMSFGAKGPSGALSHIVTRYLYEKGPVIMAEGSWSMTSSYGFEMGFLITLENAVIAFDSTRDPAFRICPEGEEAFTPELEKEDGYVRQIDSFVKTIKGEPTPSVITLGQSKDAIRIVEAEKRSLLKGGLATEI